nr:MAG TPA: hypothetical protein [Caudoviricetes sp.]
MIKILRYEKKDNENLCQYKIKEENDRISLFYKDDHQEHEAFFSKKDRGIYELIIVEGIEENELILSKKYDFIGRVGTKSGYKRKGEKIGQIFIGSKEIIFALNYVYDDIKPYENIIMPENKSMTSVFRAISEEYKELTDSFFLKQKMIDKTNIYNSITYLESQVDCLTRAILKLYKENDTLKNILKKADEYSVLNIKEERAIIEEIERDKKNVRILQKEYYKNKSEQRND